MNAAERWTPWNNTAHTQDRNRRSANLPEKTGPLNIIAICSGNICRSPTAEILLSHRLAHQSDPLVSQLLSDTIKVSSAGTIAVVGAPMDDTAAKFCQDFGTDTSNHIARAVTAEYIQNADLVLGMAREHRKSSVLLFPPANRYAYTLLELARIIENVGTEHLVDSALNSVTPLEPPVPHDADQNTVRQKVTESSDELNITVPQKEEFQILLREVVKHLFSQRHNGYTPNKEDNNVIDPIGKPVEVYQSSAAQIENGVNPLVELFSLLALKYLG